MARGKKDANAWGNAFAGWTVVKQFLKNGVGIGQKRVINYFGIMRYRSIILRKTPLKSQGKFPCKKEKAIVCTAILPPLTIVIRGVTF
jgi:hypothetical protein